MANVYIVGEDPVTVAVVERLINDYTDNLHILGNLPARGGEVKKKIPNFIRLASTTPVILLLDLDAETCAPVLKGKLLNHTLHSSCFVFNVAVDEAEAWLFADRDNFASFLKVTPSDIPPSGKTRMNGPHEVTEVRSPIKSSMYLTHKLALQSDDRTIREQLGVDTPDEKCKGREYNSVLVPFIRDLWNVETARQNADSLNRMIGRLERLDTECQYDKP